MFDLSSLMDKIETLGANNEGPKSRDSVQDCAQAVLLEILGQFMDGKTKLSEEVTHLLNALKNTSDPLMKELGMLERQTVKTMCQALLKQRELMQLQANRSEEQEELFSKIVNAEKE